MGGFLPSVLFDTYCSAQSVFKNEPLQEEVGHRPRLRGGRHDPVKGVCTSLILLPLH